MDRLSVLKVLADRSRYAVYAAVAGAADPLSTGDLAGRLGLHASTVRLHLEKLRDAGLVEVSTEGRGAVGRPQHRWALSPHAPGIGLESDSFRLLAHLLAEVAAADPAPVERAAAVGRRRGAERAGPGRGREGYRVGDQAGDDRVGDDRAGDDGAGDARVGDDRAGPAGDPRVSARRPAGVPGWVPAVMDELADLGFEPALDGPPWGTARPPRAAVAITFSRCPFRELAVRYPDVICGLHRGLTEGVAAGVSARTSGVPVSVAAFGTLLDEAPCRVELVGRR